IQRPRGCLRGASWRPAGRHAIRIDGPGLTWTKGAGRKQSPGQGTRSAMKASVNRLVLGATLVLASALGCESPNAPPPGPEETCARACAAHVPVCNQKGCRRGCNLILDRLAEHEGDTVLACVRSEE